MPTGIRFPFGLPRPLRSGYSDQFEQGRSSWQPEIGPSRHRNRFRRIPRWFELQFSFDQTEYTVFDRWHQYTILGGSLPFDIELIDDDQTILWYTVMGVGSFSHETADDGELTYLVKWKVRALDEGFTDRPAGTDELRANVSVGVAQSTGRLQVYTPMRGSTSVGMTATGRMSILPLRGSIDVGMFSLPTAKFQLTQLSYPELSRQWQNYDWLETISTIDINTFAQVVEREWMEL